MNIQTVDDERAIDSQTVKEKSDKQKAIGSDPLLSNL